MSINEGFNVDDIIFNNKGIDTISQIANYKTVKNIMARNGINIYQDTKNLPINPYIQGIYNQLEYDTKTRYKSEDFKPIIEYVKISKDRGLSSYTIIVRNIPILFEKATKLKKAKDTYCMLIYSGLHQPTKQISKETINFISKMLKRKAFKLHSIEVATDFKDKKPINYKRKDEVKQTLKKHTNPKSYILKGNTLYCNDVKSNLIKKLKTYDKYLKQSIHHKQLIHSNLNGWKRLEIELRPSKNMNFNEYIKSDEFKNDSMGLYDDISKALKVSELDNSYLSYQISGLLDNRVINNKASKKQFNSKESLVRFKMSDFKPYSLKNS